jgi:DNA-binding transcriptional regulator YiaG
MSIMNELKKEITRLARKEISKELAPVKRVNAAQRTLIANLRRDITALQKEVHTLRKTTPTISTEPKQDERSGFWITGKGIKAIRKRLGISQVQLAKLVGVSDQAVANWEGKEGKVVFRQQETAVRLAELRSMNKTTVMGELEKKRKAK